MSGKKTKEYRWYFRQIISQLIANGELDIDDLPQSPSFKVILRIVNNYKKEEPESFEELMREFTGSITR